MGFTAQFGNATTLDRSTRSVVLVECLQCRSDYSNFNQHLKISVLNLKKRIAIHAQKLTLVNLFLTFVQIIAMIVNIN